MSSCMLALASPTVPSRYDIKPLPGASDDDFVGCLLRASDASLVVASMEEQYSRARQYIEKHPQVFTDRQLRSLHRWMDMCDVLTDHNRDGLLSPEALATRSVFVVELTRTRPDWSSCTDRAIVDGSLPGPEDAIDTVRQMPSARHLSALKDSLDYHPESWLLLFIHMGGVQLLHSVLSVHATAALQLEGRAAAEANEALLVALQCLQCLCAKPAGVQAMLLCPNLTREVVSLLKQQEGTEAATSAPWNSIVQLAIMLYTMYFKSYAKMGIWGVGMANTRQLLPSKVSRSGTAAVSIQ
eukprot:364666-Chlamydomonas_euryale.AAC.3